MTQQNSRRRELQVPLETEVIVRDRGDGDSGGAHSCEEYDEIQKESHVDSDDSGLFKANYAFKSILRRGVKQRSQKWPNDAKRKAIEQSEEFKNRATAGKLYSVPLGQEINWKFLDNSSGSSMSTSSSSTSRVRTTRDLLGKDELEMKRKQEFLREVHRVLKKTQRPGFLKEEALKDEYRRQIQEKASAVAKWSSRDLIYNREPNFETKVALQSERGGGDPTCEATEQVVNSLSKFILKSELPMLRSSKDVTTKRVQFEPSSARILRETKHSSTSQELPKGLRNLNMPFCGHNMERMFKVERYLEALTSAEANSEGVSTSENELEDENVLFDRLVGRFLRSDLITSNKPVEISQTDLKLLTFLTRQYIKRGQIHLLEIILSSNLEDDKLVIPPYENVADREEYFMKKLLTKYLKRGMRSTLEDTIAKIYYEMEVKRQNIPAVPKTEMSNENVIEKMVIAYNAEGSNKSLDRLVSELSRDLIAETPNLNVRQMAGVKQQVRNSVLTRFAKTFLMKSNNLTAELEEEVNNEKGKETFRALGRHFEIRWKRGKSCSQKAKVQYYSEEETSSQFEQPMKKNKSNTGDSSLKEGTPFLPTSCGGRLVKALNIAPKFRSSKKNLKDKMRGLDRKKKIKRLLQEKELLWEARKKEASRIDRFTESLPQQLEHFVETRHKIQEELKERSGQSGEKTGPKGDSRAAKTLLQIYA